MSILVGLFGSGHGEGLNIKKRRGIHEFCGIFYDQSAIKQTIIEGVL